MNVVFHKIKYIFNEVNHVFHMFSLTFSFEIEISIEMKSLCRVATDLENLEKSGNLKETSESQGICLKSQEICDRIPKVREKSGNFVV